ncbi:MAG: hypothetical protein LM577_06265 [Thermoproteaceae archaeon]|nr:hypothetical protein [Thermoproteaceae archaeon]
MVVELEYGYRVIINGKTAVRAESLAAIKVLEPLEKAGVPDPEALVREIEKLLREAKRRARVSCRMESAAPPTITCRVENETLVVKRVGAEWYLVEPYVRRIGRRLSLAAVAAIAEKFLVMPERLYAALAEEIGEVCPEAWRVVYFHPAHDYVEGLGPVLGVRYTSGEREHFGYVYVRDGRLELADVAAPVKDEDAMIIYRPAVSDLPSISGVRVYLPDFVEILEAWREAPTFAGVAREAETYIRSRVTAPDVDVRFATAFIVTSHFFVVASYYPAFVIGKPGFAAGGTTAAKVLAALMPRPAVLLDPSWASLFRAAHIFRPTYLIDEVIMELGDEALRNIRLYLVARFDQDMSVPRADDGGARLGTYVVYSNAIIVDPQGLVANLAVVRRSPRVVLCPDPNRREIITIKKELEKPEVRRLAARLYALFLRHAAEIKAEYDRVGEIFPCRGAVLQGFGLLLLVARRMGQEYLDAVAAKIREWVDEVGLMYVIGDPSKLVLAKVLEDIENLEAYVRARLSPETGWLTPESVSGSEPPKPWRVDVEGGRVVLWTYLESWRKYLQHALGELKQVSRRKGTGEETEWVDTRVRDLGPALDRKAFAALLRPYLSHVLRREETRRNLRVAFTSLDDIARAREALRRALPEGSLAACPPEPQPAGETRPVHESPAPGAETVQSSCTLGAPPRASAECKARGEEGEGHENTESGGSGAAAPPAPAAQQEAATSARRGREEETPQDEERAREELERFIAEHAAGRSPSPPAVAPPGASAEESARARHEDRVERCKANIICWNRLQVCIWRELRGSPEEKKKAALEELERQGELFRKCLADAEEYAERETGRGGSSESGGIRKMSAREVIGRVRKLLGL